MLPQEQTDHDDIKIKKLELLNSILMKELLESKDKITNLTEENEKLKAENLKLKNFQSTNDIDSHIKIERIKNEPLNIDSNEDNHQNPHKSTMDIIENTLSSTNKSTKNEENRSFQEETKISEDKDQNQNAQARNSKNIGCDICGKSFIESRNLKNHKKSVHEGIKEVKCKSCEKSFTTKRRSEGHQETFKGNCSDLATKKESAKKHKCDTCGKYLIDSRNLKNHIKSVHKGIKEFKCDSCEIFFATKQTLYNHKEKCS